MIANFWKSWLLGGLLVLSIGPAAAGEDPIDAFLSCRGIADNGARLACFDAIDFGSPSPAGTAGKAPEQVGERTQDRTVQQRPGAGKKGEPAGFGAESIQQSRKKLAERPKSLTATLAEVRFNRIGKPIFILDNGQVWHQIKGDSRKIFLPREVKGLEVIIKRKLLGSFALRLKGTKNAVRVRRGR